MSLWDEWDIETEKQWEKFIELDGIGEKLTPEEFKKEMETERERILGIIDSGFLSQASIGLKGAVNYFIVNDMAYGGICDKCGSDGIVILIMDQNYTDNLEEKIWAPGLETYMAMHIMPGSDAFKRMFPVPINPATDYWYCPKCGELHKFKYDNEIGLIYDQDVI